MRKSARKVVSTGDISTINIPDGSPYAGALKRIQGEAIGTGVTIDLETFYSDQPVELHNFVSSITYRFVDAEGTKAIAYLVEGRDSYGSAYKEVAFDGTVLFSFPEDLLWKPERTEEEDRWIRRANNALGVYARFVSDSEDSGLPVVPQASYIVLGALLGMIAVSCCIGGVIGWEQRNLWPAWLSVPLGVGMGPMFLLGDVMTLFEGGKQEMVALPQSLEGGLIGAVLGWLVARMRSRSAAK